MYEQPNLAKWGIFYCDFDKRNAQTFMDMMQKCCEQFKYKASRPREFCVNGTRSHDWIKSIEQNLNDSVQAVVLILPGQKGKAPLYDDLKKLLINKIPVPSQVVISSTISKGKNVRSICNKILIQICAKIGGEPWAVSDLPFFDRPTMICGMDTYKKLGVNGKSIMAVTASLN